MVSKSQIKRITALHLKKYRQQEKCFIAEGRKVISELLASGFRPVWLYVLDGSGVAFPGFPAEPASANDLERMSALDTAPNCLAVFEMRNPQTPVYNGLVVALDEIRDPGNLGTIIRLCDWFGVKELVCSPGTADVYNPKVVQATMGSLARVNVTYMDLASLPTALPLIGTFMDGENIYRTELPQDGILVLGNEANGISLEVGKRCGKRLAIPRFGEQQVTESLNVATATAVLLSEFRRR